MGSVLDLLKDEVERTIQSLDLKQFTPDPIAGRYFSKITSVMSSAYKRHELCGKLGDEIDQAAW